MKMGRNHYVTPQSGVTRLKWRGVTGLKWRPESKGETWRVVALAPLCVVQHLARRSAPFLYKNQISSIGKKYVMLPLQLLIDRVGMYIEKAEICHIALLDQLHQYAVVLPIDIDVKLQLHPGRIIVSTRRSGI